MYLTYGLRRINCILSSISMHCSQLNSDLFIHNIIDNKYCLCGREETAYHYFFQCQNYIIPRNTMMNETRFIENLDINIILNGADTHSKQDNIMLHTAVSKFIIATNRFQSLSV